MSLTSSLSGSARRALRAAAHHLDPVVTIGQAGLTPAVLHEIDIALAAHALIKVRVASDERETRERYLSEVCASLACEPVQHLGKLLVLWRNRAEDETESPEVENPSRHPGRGPRAALPDAGRQARRSVPAGRAPTYSASTRRRDAPADWRRNQGEDAEVRHREPWAPRGRRGAAHGQDGRYESERAYELGRRPRDTAAPIERRRRAPEGEARSRWGERRPRADAWSEPQTKGRIPGDPSSRYPRPSPRGQGSAPVNTKPRPRSLRSPTAPSAPRPAPRSRQRRRQDD